MRQDRISCDAAFYRYEDRVIDIFEPTDCLLRQAQVVPLEIPVLFECSMVQPAFLKTLTGSDVVLQFKASGNQGPGTRAIHLSPITIVSADLARTQLS